MLKAISTHIFLKHRLHAGHLDTCMRAGAEGIEIFAARNHFDFTNRSQVREIADWFRSNPLVAWALHAPLRMDTENERGGAISINVVHAEKARRIEAMMRSSGRWKARSRFRFGILFCTLARLVMPGTSARWNTA